MRSFQALRHRLADLATELECARLSEGSPSVRRPEGEPGTGQQCDAEPSELFPREASMARLRRQPAEHTAPVGTQLTGGYGHDRTGHGTAFARTGPFHGPLRRE
ncbi:hypothetical protein [Streptomyces bathyalis]|uniref:hypothetical protein n=1 Tax=Streptomyces bathyalis TaxID=2710756 RepID=UPI001FE6BFC9|nr:hypothetical protein [Streptomyces bathyalis]